MTIIEHADNTIELLRETLRRTAPWTDVGGAGRLCWCQPHPGRAKHSRFCEYVRMILLSTSADQIERVRNTMQPPAMIREERP